MKSDCNYLKSDQYEWIFFDFFDTIVHRSENKDAIKMIWAKKIFERLLRERLMQDVPIKAYDLLDIREKSEKLVKEATGRSGEIKYAQVCRKIYDFLSNYLKIDEADFYKVSLECDVEAELSVQYLDDETVDMLKEAKARNKKVAVVSDFYLPEDAFRIFITHHRIEELIDRIFISNDYDASKREGNLYTKVKKKLGVDTALMIGDNIVSDKAQAEKNGLTAIHKEYSETEKPLKDYYYMKKEINKYIRKCESLGPYAGYILNIYCFLEKLYIECLKKGYKKIYFLSREGQRLKELFDMYIKDKNNIATQYLCISRFSMIKASEDEKQLKEFHKYLELCGIQGKEDLVIVDIGWKGTVQTYFSHLVENTIYGYYFGIRDISECEHKSKKIGLLYDAYPKKSIVYNTYCYNSTIQEQLLVADHGTILKYENGRPIIADDLQNEKIYRHLYQRRCKENCIFLEIKELLEGTCYYLNDFEMLLAKNYLKMSLNTSRAYKQERKILNALDTTIDDEALRMSGKEEEALSKKQKIKRMLRRYRDVYRDNKEPIEYLRVFMLYSKQLKLSWLYPVLAKIIYRAEMRFLRKKSGS